MIVLHFPSYLRSMATFLQTDAAAKRALALDGADMGGFFLKIQPYNASRSSNTKTSNFTPPVVQGYNRIYVGNLSWDITEEDLRKFLSGCNISSIRFGLDKETGEFRGYAHVDFSDSDSMNMALKLNQKVLYGRPVKVTSAIPKKNVKVQPEAVAAAADKVGVDSSASTAVGSEKMRRRTCHLCGEKGHFSSACSKNADEKQQPEAIAATVDDIGVDRSASTVVGSGKIRRRTCYLCGEKGHISSACPKNLESPANSSKI
ncbi:hypothetical protein SAY86_018061 [Trapa natans]|uniref:Uncharacterized protein n=1 Tax=Trapa natans TaxID=22666 RepID=A0AAN7R5M2_TRANT|nr:hypothetical protein SAY86_018061 [Trapa natans]